MSRKPISLDVSPARRGLSGAVRVPGDKSISHRALMLGALAAGVSRISGLLEGEDVLRTAAALRGLGAPIWRDGADWLVAGRGIGGLVAPTNVIDMGNSGTAARLLCGIIASHPLTAVLTGDPSLCRRPMQRVTDPLSYCGARFAGARGGRLPLTIEGTGGALPIHYQLPVASAQVKSAILLAGLNARGQTHVIEREPTRDHTENILRHFGADVCVEQSAGGADIYLQGRPELHAVDLIVPGDPSSAAFPLVAAILIPGSSVRILNVGINPSRVGLLSTLKEMGADVRQEQLHHEGGEPVADILVGFSELTSVDVPKERAPSMIDEYPILAVAAAFARGTTRMRGLRELRVKESDRLAATAALLRANGVAAVIDGDDLLVTGDGRPPPGGGIVTTDMDHRIAMSAIVLGLATADPVHVDDISFIDTSFPDFLALMNRLGAGLSVPG